MRLARCDGDHPGWGLVDEGAGALRQIAGGLAAWAPRIAGGEGRWALPLTGRIASRQLDPGSDLRPLLRRQFDVGPPCAAMEDLVLGAVVGAPLAGRRNPLRSILGYAMVTPRTCGPVLLTRDEFGDAPPGCMAAHEVGGCGLGERIAQMDASVRLGPGDILLLGPVIRAADMFDRLMGADLGAPALDAAPPCQTRREAPFGGASA